MEGRFLVSSLKLLKPPLDFSPDPRFGGFVVKDVGGLWGRPRGAYDHLSIASAGVIPILEGLSIWESFKAKTLQDKGHRWSK